MTRGDAIYYIKQLAVLSTEKEIPKIEEALNMAITALETMSCEECKHYVYQLGCTHHGNCAYEPKTEPQTDCAWGRRDV